MAGTRVGEAWYELDARDQKLLAAFDRAEGRARKTGGAIEKGIGTGADKGFDRTGAAATRFGGALGKVEGQTTRFGGVMKNLGFGVLQGVGIAGFLGVTAAAGAMVQGIGSAIGAASNLNETVDMVKATFAGTSEEIIAWSKTSADAFGMSQNSALSYAGTFGGLLMNMGQTEEASTKMSMSMVELAADMASFGNSTPEEALEALRAGLIGETEPLRRFQVNLNEARIKAKALELGLYSGKGAIDAAAKSQATYALIMEDTSRQQGNFAQTAGSLANQQRSAAAQMENALARLGQTIMPLAQAAVPILVDGIVGLVDAISGVVEGIGRWADENRPLVDALGWLADVIVRGIGHAVNQMLQSLTNAANGIGMVFTAISDVVKFIVGNIIGSIRNVMEIAALVPGPWQESARQTADALNKMQNDVEAWGQKTSQSAKTGADDVVQNTAGTIEAGAPVVAAAAATGITDPVVSAASAAAAGSKEEAKKTVRDFADELQENRFSVKDAWDAINDVAKNTMSKQKEIAEIEAFLTSDRMKAGLKSKRPEVRAEFDAWKQAAEERLFALRNNVPDIAQRTGQSYANTLAAKKAAAGTAAQQVAFRVRDELNIDLTNSGRHAGNTWIDGLNLTAKRAKAVAHNIANNVNDILGFSLPKEGPLRQIRTWGMHAGQTWAEGLESALPDVERSSLAFAMGPRAVLAPGAAQGGSGGGSITHQRSWSGDLNVHLHAVLASTDSNDVRRVGRQLGEEVRLTLVRGPGLFAMDGTQ